MAYPAYYTLTSLLLVWNSRSSSDAATIYPAISSRCMHEHQAAASAAMSSSVFYDCTRILSRFEAACQSKAAQSVKLSRCRRQNPSRASSLPTRMRARLLERDSERRSSHWCFEPYVRCSCSSSLSLRIVKPCICRGTGKTTIFSELIHRLPPRGKYGTSELQASIHSTDI